MSRSAKRILASFRPGQLRTIAEELLNPNKEQARALPDSRGGETPKQQQTYRTDMQGYFVQPGQKLLYSAETWVRARLTLQTAGPVAIGTRANILPVQSGKGILLDTDVPYETVLPRGARLYIAAGAVNRVNVTIEPIPWLEQLSGEINAITAAVTAGARAIVSGVVSAVTGTRGATGAATAMAAAVPAPPPIPPTSIRVLPRRRLTPFVGRPRRG